MEAALEQKTMLFRVQALETAIQQLVDVQTTNLAAIKQAFTMVDAHLFVMQRICNDIVNGRVRVAPMHPDDQAYLASDPPWSEERVRYRPCEGSNINLAWYHYQYNQAQKLDLLVAALATLPVEPEGSEAADPDVTEEFGGDYGKGA